jgi:hypothetical protein
MRKIGLPDGDFALPCGATLRVEGAGLTAFFGPGAPTPSRATVTREASARAGLPLWLESWPDDSALSHGVEWPGIGCEAIVLDHRDRVRDSRDLRELGAILGEIFERSLHAEPGWQALGVDPERLPTFGGERPVVPDSFFWRWAGLPPGHTAVLPARALSWDTEQLLLAPDPAGRPFSIPRHPGRLFGSRLASRAGLAPCTDAEAFERLATVLPWDGSYEVLGGGLIALSAHDRWGRRYEAGNPRELAVIVREVGWSRSVVAVASTAILRDPGVAALLREQG